MPDSHHRRMMTLSIKSGKATRQDVTLSVPHPIPYQGSKRTLAATICDRFPPDIKTLFEPFAGSAAITLYAARHGLARHYVIGDSAPELMELWRTIIETPDHAAKRYADIWRRHETGGPDYFNDVRDRFNRDRDPVKLLYLMARCVKNAVRFNQQGKFTQSVDKRRLGTRPERMGTAIRAASHWLKDRTKIVCADFTQTLRMAGRRDLAYLDPPYQGITDGSDKRYFAQVEREALIVGLGELNQRNIPFVLSYDGATGQTTYGQALPEHLGMQRLLLNAGRSTQATLHGRHEITVESLYLSRELARKTAARGSARDKPRRALIAAE